jgi:hypothetical protein
MIISNYPHEAVSFTDDTSPDTRNSKKRNVSIHAQVRKDKKLDWYFDFLSLCQKERGELKSQKVRAVYLRLPAPRRAKLWESLQEVRINITDPLPYMARTEQVAAEVFDKKDAIEVIRARAIANDQIAKDLLEMLNNHTAESILLDAPSRTLSLYLEASQGIGGYGLGKHLRGFGFRPRMKEISIEPFKSKNPGSIIRNVTNWTSKSASVYTEAFDSISSDHFYPFQADAVYRRLMESHAFDEGNEKAIGWVEQDRDDVVKHVEYYSDFARAMRYRGRPRPSRLYGGIDSRRSFYVQAADIAGGIAALLYEQGLVFEVAKYFKSVMFNGWPITQAEAYEAMVNWRERRYLEGKDLPIN